MKRIKAWIMTFWNYRDLTVEMVTKDIKLKYRRSFLGYVWSILNPLLVMIVMAVVFSHIFRFSIENYPVYLFTGQILFNFFHLSSGNALVSITGNAPLLKKVYVPKYIFTVTKITSGYVDLLFSLGALLLVMAVTGAHFSWYNLLFIFPIIQLYVFTIGFGLFLAAANVYFRDTQYIFNAVITAWMYATPIFYPIEQVSGTLGWIIRHFNPMYFYVGQFRDLMYYNRMPGAGIILEGCIAAILSLVIGTYVFLKKQDGFILYI